MLALMLCIAGACAPIDTGALGPQGGQVSTTVAGKTATYPCVRCEFALASNRLYADGDRIFVNSLE